MKPITTQAVSPTGTPLRDAFMQGLENHAQTPTSEDSLVYRLLHELWLTADAAALEARLADICELGIYGKSFKREGAVNEGSIRADVAYMHRQHLDFQASSIAEDLADDWRADKLITAVVLESVVPAYRAQQVVLGESAQAQSKARARARVKSKRNDFLFRLFLLGVVLGVGASAIIR